jgi:hypothetical protein
MKHNPRKTFICQTYSRNFPSFMESELHGMQTPIRSSYSLCQPRKSQLGTNPEGWLPCSQQPLVACVLSLTKSVHTLQTNLLKIHFNIVFHQHTRLLTGFFPSGFLYICQCYTTSQSYLLHLLTLIIFCGENKLRFSSLCNFLLSFHYSYVKIFFSSSSFMRS